MKKVVFINYYNKGDIHVSRGFIRQIIEKIKSIDPSTSFACAHKHSPDLLSDIEDLKFEPEGLLEVHNECTRLHQNPQYTGVCKINDTIYINTWYGQKENEYLKKYGVSIDAIYAAMDDSCKEVWNFSLSDISKDPSAFFPIIDYSKFKINSIDEWLKSHTNKKIFISNGPALSGQAINFNFSKVIEKLSKENLDKIFLLTEFDSNLEKKPNIFYTKEIINKKEDSDLNENAYISHNSDIIIGRASGPSSFAINYENLFTGNKKFIYFCNFYSKNNFWTSDLFKDKINYSAKFVLSDTGDEDTVYNIIKSNI